MHAHTPIQTCIGQSTVCTELLLLLLKGKLHHSNILNMGIKNSRLFGNISIMEMNGRYSALMSSGQDFFEIS